jgi:hypothetical protein
MAGRLYCNGAGPVLTSDNLALHANWGTGATVAIATGSNDQRGTLTVTSKTTSKGASPTITVTFNRAYGTTPVVVVCKGDAVDTEEFAVTEVSTTGFVVTLVGTPSGGDVAYAVNYFVVG